MDLYPAIDLRGGRVVRLLQGDYDAQTTYSDDPVAQALAFADAGARWIHTVDLDAARSGEATNAEVIGRISDAVRDRGVKVQAGGGVRTPDAAARLLDRGVERVVVGTAAVEHPELVDEMVDGWPARIAVGLDVRGATIAVRGWTEDAGVSLVDATTRFERAGVAALVLTQIDVDGTLSGPDLGLYETVLGATSIDVIASGGVGRVDDVDALAALRVGDRTLSGVIIGKALYEGRFRLEEAIRACSPSV